MSSPVARPLEVVCWPRGRGEPPVYWIVERNPAKPGDCFAILGPYSSRADADEGVRREVARTAGLMLRECSYCKRVLGAVPCLPQFSGLVTHGVCPDCEDKLRSSLGLEKRS